MRLGSLVRPILKGPVTNNDMRPNGPLGRVVVAGDAGLVQEQKDFFLVFE